MVHHMICGLCFPLFLLVCFVCRHEISVPRVLSLQSLTLGTSVLPCGLFEQWVCMALNSLMIGPARMTLECSVPRPCAQCQRLKRRDSGHQKFQVYKQSKQGKTV